MFACGKNASSVWWSYGSHESTSVILNTSVITVVICVVRQMSTGQKYRRTEFEDNDDNNSAGEATSPGVVYNPVIAFHSASFGNGRGGLIGRGCCARWSGLEKLLMAVVAALSVVVIVLMAMLGARGHPDAMWSTNAVSSRLHAEAPATTGANSNGIYSSAYIHHVFITIKY